MGKVAEKDENRQLSVHLPKPFIDRFKNYVKKKNESLPDVKHITEREMIYDALEELMRKHPIT